MNGPASLLHSWHWVLSWLFSLHESGFPDWNRYALRVQNVHMVGGPGSCFQVIAAQNETIASKWVVQQKIRGGKNLYFCNLLYSYFDIRRSWERKSPLWLSSPRKLPFTWPQKGAWTWLSGYDEDMLVGLGFTTVPVPSTSNNLSIPYKKLKKVKVFQGNSTSACSSVKTKLCPRYDAD